MPARSPSSFTPAERNAGGGIAGVGAFGALLGAYPATASGGPAPVPIVLGFVISAGLMVAAAVATHRNLA